MNKQNQYIKLSEHNRVTIYELYRIKSKTQQQLAQLYGVSRQTISLVVKRAKLGDFSIHKPVNIRWNTQKYIDKREQKRIDRENKIALRKSKAEELKKTRYEHKLPNFMLHMDLKLLPPILGEKVVVGQKQ
jgi:predicted XRE-type DNA-binding protein